VNYEEGARMNIKDFFELTGKVRAAQKKYFLGGRLQGDLIASKQLESKLDKALSEGIPEPTATVHVYTTEEYQRQLGLTDNAAEYVTLDLPGIERPTDEQGEQPT
jgi:hypothetical protein